jgi:hypothetical protein
VAASECVGILRSTDQRDRSAFDTRARDQGNSCGSVIVGTTSVAGVGYCRAPGDRGRSGGPVQPGFGDARYELSVAVMTLALIARAPHGTASAG